MVAERHHDFVEFLEGDEAAAVTDFVVVDRICQFGNFRSERSITVAELATFNTFR